MLEVIIKRDGTEENFDSRKANKWLMWAGHDLIERVDWVGIVKHAMDNAPEVMSSQDFQMALIKGCLSRFDWPHNLMAGRLYAPYLRKKLYGDTMPTVRELHLKLQKMGLMIDMWYTEQEYLVIEKFMEHDRDFTMTYFQLAHDNSKYAIANRTTGEVYETPQFVAIRMAMHICAKGSESGQKRLDNIKTFYNNYSLGLVSSPSPNYSNLGTHNRGLASCCLIAAGDSAVSLAIANHIVFTMTYKSAGEGLYLGCRSILDPVRGGAISHNGKLPYLSSFGKAVKANKQGSRSGALTTHVSVYDPEIMDLIAMQNPRTPLKKQNRDQHLSVMDNFFFAQKVAKREKYFTFNAYTAPDLHAALFSGDRARFAELYNKYENDDTFNKTYLDAYDVACAFEIQGHEVSTVYNLDIGECNIHTSFKEPIYSSNLCVAPETPILTKEYGYRAIGELRNKEVHVWNGQQWSLTTVKQTAINRELVAVGLDGSGTIHATKQHRWIVETKTGEVIKQTQELEVGDMLVQCSFGEVSHGKLRLLGIYDTWTAHHHTAKTRADYLLQAPGNEISMVSRIEWLSGAFDTMFEVVKKDGFTQLSMKEEIYSCLDDPYAVPGKMRLFLQELGFDSFMYKAGGERWGLLIDEHVLAGLISGGLSVRELDLSDVRKDAPVRKRHVVVSSVSYNGRRDNTYCFTEPLKNQGVFAGVLTKNCQEISQPTQAYESMRDLYSSEDHGRGEVSLCSLGGIPIPRFPLKKCEDLAYEQACYVAVVTADTCIDLSEYEFPHMEMTAKARRNIAIGMTGIAEYFARHSIRFDTPYGLEIASRLAERHLYYVIKASLRLAREKGNAPWIDKTKWPSGWLPLDSYKKTVDTIVPNTLHYDWEALRQEIIEQGGIRNSALIAHMPFESSSKRHAHPNGVYPIRELYLNKTDGGNSIDWCAPDGDLIGDDYQLAFDICTEDLIKYYAVLQKFADQSISADFYEDRTKHPRISKDTLIERYLLRKRLGVKAKYYSNSKLPNKTVDDFEVVQQTADFEVSEAGCEGGSCTC